MKIRTDKIEFDLSDEEKATIWIDEQAIRRKQDVYIKLEYGYDQEEFKKGDIVRLDYFLDSLMTMIDIARTDVILLKEENEELRKRGE